MRTEEAIAGIFNGVVDAYNMVSNVESLPYAVFQVSENPVSSKDVKKAHGSHFKIVVTNPVVFIAVS